MIGSSRVKTSRRLFLPRGMVIEGSWHPRLFRELCLRSPAIRQGYWARRTGKRMFSYTLPWQVEFIKLSIKVMLPGKLYRCHVKKGISVTRTCATGQAAWSWSKSILGAKAFWVFTHISHWHPDCSGCRLCYWRRAGPITLMLHDKLLTDLLAFEVKGISKVNGLSIYCLLKLLCSSN